MAQQATLETRPEKQVRSLADLTGEWRERASHLLNEDATRWAHTVTANDAQMLLRADDVPLDVIASLGRSEVEAVGEKRSTWRRWNLTAGYRINDAMRVGLSIALFLCLLLAWKLGYIQPTGLPAAVR